VQLCHGPAHHAECIADTCGQPSRVVSARQSGASSLHRLMLPATSLTGKRLACRYILPSACGSIDLMNPASDGRRLKGQAEPREDSMTDRTYDPARTGRLRVDHANDFLASEGKLISRGIRT